MLPKWSGRQRLAVLFTAALCCAEACDALCRNGVFTLGIFQYLEGMNSQRTSMGCCLCLCTPAPPQFLKEPHPLSPDQTLKSDLGFKFRGGDNPSFSVALCSEQTESVGASHTLDWQMRKLLMSNVVSAHYISCISTKLDFVLILLVYVFSFWAPYNPTVMRNLVFITTLEWKILELLKGSKVISLSS